MELCGHNDKKEQFAHLTQSGALAHAYLFWGESHIGKFTFAKNLVMRWDTNFFETLVITPGEGGSIGIDQIREIKNFLWQKPIFAPRRTVILDSLETATDESQNALLKLIEEPPAYALIIGIVTNPELLFPTIQSRFQKIYFSRVSTEELKKFSRQKLHLSPSLIDELAEAAQGRPGLLVDWETNNIAKNALARAKEFLAHPQSRSKLIVQILDAETGVETQSEIDSFFYYLVALLRKNTHKNHRALRAIITKITNMNRFQTNKKLQLEALAHIL